MLTFNFSLIDVSSRMYVTCRCAKHITPLLDNVVASSTFQSAAQRCACWQGRRAQGPPHCGRLRPWRRPWKEARVLRRRHDYHFSISSCSSLSRASAAARSSSSMAIRTLPSFSTAAAPLFSDTLWSQLERPLEKMHRHPSWPRYGTAQSTRRPCASTWSRTSFTSSTTDGPSTERPARAWRAAPPRSAPRRCSRHAPLAWTRRSLAGTPRARSRWRG